MSNPRTNRIRIAAMALAAPIVLLIDARDLGAELGEPSVETLRSLVEGYAHAIETNNRELALRYVHPRSPRRSVIDAALRDHEDAVARNAAMEVYVARAELQPLHELLRDADEEIRSFAAGMLGNIGEGASTDVLARALDEDTDVNVRHSAAVALGQLGASAAVPQLIRALHTLQTKRVEQPKRKHGNIPL